MPSSPCLVTRFAPAPTGYLHLGHVHNAVHVWRLAREEGGRVRLRIEDHDSERCRPEYERAIREDLGWLGFEPDDEVPRQSTRGAIYRELLEPLVAADLVYGCACTRQQMAASPTPGSGERWYPGTCRHRQLGLREGLGWRVRMDPGLERFADGWLGPQVHDPSRQCGDVLVRDRVGQWTYQWAVVVDDFLQGITDVVRGRDLLESTGRQIRLGRLAGRPEPARFFHHALVMKSPAQKLSKSDRDTSVRDLRASGWTPAGVLAAAVTS